MDVYSDRRSGAGGSVSAVLPCTIVSAIEAPRRGVLGVTGPRGPDQVNSRNLIPAQNAQPEERGDHVAAPLGSSRSGRLRFLNGALQIVSRPARAEPLPRTFREPDADSGRAGRGRDRPIPYFSDRRMAEPPVGACRQGCAQPKHPLGYRSSRQRLQVSRRLARVASLISSPWRHAAETAGSNS